jgi:3-methylfumaryl-CoA hydratase
VNATTPRPASGAPGALPGAKRRTWLFTPGNRPDRFDKAATLLFRFSALTYNAHRIHYDRGYARDVEGYPGLVVHGPLQALAMAETARAAGRQDNPDAGDRTFDYRLLSPLFDHQGMVVSAVRERDAISTAVRDGYGRQTASGTLRSSR